MKYLLPYFKACGFYSCVAIVVFLVIYRLCNIWVDMCIRDWTDDHQLRNTTEMSSDSRERYIRNIFYIQKYLVTSAIYGTNCNPHYLILQTWCRSNVVTTL